MCLMIYFFSFYFCCCCCHKRQYYSKFISKAQYFQKQNAVVLRFEIVSNIKLAVLHQFSLSRYCCLFFKLSKNPNVMVLLLLTFSFFLWSPMPLRLVEKLFQKLGYLCFSNFLIWFSHSRLMEINSTHVYFRSRMLCFDDDTQKDKNIFKENSQSDHFIY